MASAARPSGLIAWLSNGLTTRRHLRRPPGVGDDLLDGAAATAGSVTVAPSGATKTICAPAPAAPGETSASWSSASCDSEPGMVNRSSNEPPSVTSSATTAPRIASQATETSPRWR